MNGKRTELICLNCGNVFPIYRRDCCLKTQGHIKDLWCYKCQKVTKHYEVRELSRYSFYDEENELDRYVNNLVFYKKKIYSDEYVKKLIK